MITKAAERKQQGVALIIAIFTMMLISVVATAWILTAGIASAVKVNYKNSMQAFYDAKAGLEEGRSRIWTGNPSTMSTCVLTTTSGSPVSPGNVCYIVNPDPTTNETVNPTDPNPNNPYYDSEYQNEFSPSGEVVQQPLQTSTSPVANTSIAGPLYKWVRITPRTGQSAGVNADGTAGSDTNPLFYCVDINSSNCSDGMAHEFPWNGVGTLPTDGSTQVFTVTSFAVAPMGGGSGRRMLQYAVAENPNPVGQIFANIANSGANSTPVGVAPVNQVFPAALTMIGNRPDDNWYNATNSSGFYMNGNDRMGPNATPYPGPSPASCSLAALAPVAGLGVSGSPTDVETAIKTQRLSNYLGQGYVPPGNSPASPSVENISGIFPAYALAAGALQSLVNSVTNAASEVVAGPATNLPSYGSASSPVVAVVQGDLTLADVTGYGVLLVTGKLTVTGTAGWRGIVLVIGQGVMDGSGITTGTGSNVSEFDGAVLLARVGTGIPLLNWKNGQGNGFYYDSCWISNAAAAFPYQVLSFREIPLAQ